MMKKTTALFAAIVLLLTVIPVGSINAHAIAYGSCGQHVTYYVSEDGVLTLSGSGDTKDYKNISGTTNPFKTLDNGKLVKKVIVGDGIRYIGAYFFAWCTEITSVELPDSLEEIGQDAFYACRKLKSIHIPGNLRIIDDSAFYGTGLEYITADEDNPFYVCVDNCLIERSSGTLVQGCMNSIIPSDGSVTAIGAYAFSDRYVKQLVIPESVTSIGRYALWTTGSMIMSVCFDGTAEQWEKIEKQPPTITAGKVKIYPGHDLRLTVGKKPTCTEEGAARGVCAVCGTAKDVVLPPAGHTVMKDKAVPPTCTAEGLTEGSHCSVCGEVFTEQKSLPMTEHIKKTLPAVSPTFETDGLTEGCACADCGLVFVGQEPVPRYIYGDVDFDGEVSAADARLALRRSIALEYYTPADLRFTAADVDRDGVVTPADARFILRKVVGLIDF